MLNKLCFNKAFFKYNYNNNIKYIHRYNNNILNLVSIKRFNSNNNNNINIPISNYNSNSIDVLKSLLNLINSNPNNNLTSNQKHLFIKYWKLFKYNNIDIINKHNLSNTINTDVLIDFFNKHSSYSSSIRATYRKELLFNSLNNNNNNNKTIIQSFITNITSLKNLNFTYPNDNLSLSLLKLCIKDSIISNDILIAADLFIFYYRNLYPNQSEIDLSITHEILNLLSLSDPKFDNLYLIKFLNIYDLFDSKSLFLNLTNLQISSFCSKALSLYPSIKNNKKFTLIDNNNDNFNLQIAQNALNKLMNPFSYDQRIKDSNFRSQDITLAYLTIEKNYLSGNVAGVYYNWIRCKNYYFSLSYHDPRILFKVINTLTHAKKFHNEVFNIIDNLSPNLYCNNRLLLPLIIDFFTKKKKNLLIEKLINDIDKFTLPKNIDSILNSKNCLNSILNSRLQFNNSKSVDEILLRIKDKYGTYSTENFKTIITFLLKTKSNSNLNKALNLILKFPINTTINSIPIILDYLIDHQLHRMKFDYLTDDLMNLIEKILKQAQDFDPNHNYSIWNTISAMFFKKLVLLDKPIDSNNSTNLKLAKLLFLKNYYDKDFKNNQFSYNPFSSTSPFDINITISVSNTAVILKTIGYSAYKNYNDPIFQWTCSELYKLGFTKHELLFDWASTLQRQIRIGKYDKKSDVDSMLEMHSPYKVRKLLDIK